MEYYIEVYDWPFVQCTHKSNDQQLKDNILFFKRQSVYSGFVHHRRHVFSPVVPALQMSCSPQSYWPLSWWCSQGGYYWAWRRGGLEQVNGMASEEKYSQVKPLSRAPDGENQCTFGTNKYRRSLLLNLLIRSRCQQLSSNEPVTCLCLDRELLEESGLTVDTLDKIGNIKFEFIGETELLDVHIFRADSFHGEPTESDGIYQYLYL